MMTVDGMGHRTFTNDSYNPLASFKSNNGFRRIDVPRYYVPLTVRGSLAVKLGFHRRIADRTPEGVLATFRRLRGVWYARG